MDGRRAVGLARPSAQPCDSRCLSVPHHDCPFFGAECRSRSQRSMARPQLPSSLHVQCSNACLVPADCSATLNSAGSPELSCIAVDSPAWHKDQHKPGVAAVPCLRPLQPLCRKIHALGVPTLCICAMTGSAATTCMMAVRSLDRLLEQLASAEALLTAEC